MQDPLRSLGQPAAGGCRDGYIRGRPHQLCRRRLRSISAFCSNALEMLPSPQGPGPSACGDISLVLCISSLSSKSFCASAFWLPPWEETLWVY